MNSTTSKSFLRGALIATSMAVALGAAGLAQAASSDTVKSDATAATKKTERVVSDSWITTKVKSELLANEGTKAFKVSVKTKHGEVALTGKLPTQEGIDQVKGIAEKVKGVKSVDTSGLMVASK
ncbi:MAG: BON domain-containing protein [Burkholderiaceae bacterium]